MHNHTPKVTKRTIKLKGDSYYSVFRNCTGCGKQLSKLVARMER